MVCADGVVERRFPEHQGREDRRVLILCVAQEGKRRRDSRGAREWRDGVSAAVGRRVRGVGGWFVNRCVAWLCADRERRWRLVSRQAGVGMLGLDGRAHQHAGAGSA